MKTKFLLNEREVTKEELREAIGDTYFDYCMERADSMRECYWTDWHCTPLPNGDVVEMKDFEDDTDDDEDSKYASEELRNLVAELARKSRRSEADVEEDIRYYAQFVADEQDDVDKAYEDAERELGIHTQEQHFLFIDLVDAVLGKIEY